ncbi:transporter substrate-binding domain-containing protein [Roseobacter sp. HKCCA0434]|uniref:substrate-binding periplasmic protein n=1 Tax=Roseobacter sp. HKCCA0434 TaxID=3079297 RepID=UPI002905D275|nr:transporter substrate-binding domain-containing protein [Roseobacter sp. HKCCA0434]
MIRRGLAICCLLAGLATGDAAWAQDPCAYWPPQPKPQNTDRDIVGQDIDTIRERGFITFALYENFPPYSWEDGATPRGVDVEIARIVADDLGVEPRFTFVTPGDRLEDDLRNWIWRGPVVGGAVVNVMMRVPYDARFACRVEQVGFTGQYTGESIAIAYDAESYPDGGPVPAYFRFEPVAVQNDSITDFYLSSFAGGQLSAHIRRFPRMTGAMAALNAGEVPAAMGPLGQLEWGAGDGIAVHQPPLAGFAVSKWTLGVAIHFAYRPLAYSVDDAIAAALADGRIAAIHAEYGISFQPPER